MRKILLLTTLLAILGGASFIKAAKTDWSPSTTWAWANATWTPGTNTFAWDGTSWLRAIETGFQNRDLSSYTQFHATVSSLTGDGVNKLQLKVNCTGGTEKMIDLTSGENLIDMTDWFTDPSAVTTFELWGPSSSTVACSAVVTDVYLFKPDAPSIKTPILLTGGKFDESFVPGTIVIEMQGWQNFVAYEDGEGVSFDEDSYMQFDLDESVSNGSVRVTFTFSDATTHQVWWCLGIGDSKDDTSTPYYHSFDESKYWLKKGLSAVWDEKKDLKITKVTIDNFDSENVYTYKVNGGTLCGQPMTIKKGSAKTFGAYGGEFRATAAQTNIFKMENFEVGDYQKIVFKFAEPVPANWAYNYQSGVWPPSIGEGATELEIPLSGVRLPELTIFNWDPNPDPIKISEVYFYKTVIEASEIIEAPSSTRDLNGMTGKGEIRWSLSYPIEMGPAIGIGGDLNTDNNSVDISSYDYLHFYVTSVETGKKLSARVFVSEEERNDNDKRHCLYLRPIADAANPSTNWEEVYYITEPGTYVAKISDYPLLRGIKGGNGWGGDESTGKITIPQAYLSSGDPVDYIPSGKYTLVGEGVASASLTTALADANATFYDATGVTGTGVDLTGAANPNALFKANSGVLANTQNVITSGTCANLVLTDNYPFQAPAAFTATSVSYSRTLTTDQTTTVCLPFALTAEEAASRGKFYTLTSLDGETLTFTRDEDEISANTPYLFVPSATAFEEYSSKSIAATPASLSVAGTGCTFIGTMERTFLKSDGSKTIYAYNNGSFVQIGSTNGAYLPAFRAYISIPSGGSVKALNIKLDDTETAISEVKKEGVKSKKTIFNVAGQRMSKLQKGLNIVNGKKVLVK